MMRLPFHPDSDTHFYSYLRWLVSGNSQVLCAILSLLKYWRFEPYPLLGYSKGLTGGKSPVAPGCLRSIWSNLPMFAHKTISQWAKWLLLFRPHSGLEIWQLIVMQDISARRKTGKIITSHSIGGTCRWDVITCPCPATCSDFWGVITYSCPW